jgi:WD40 repeat protein
MATLGDLIFTGANRHQGVEGGVRIWNSFTGELIAEIGTSLNSIFGLAVSPDGRFVAAGGGGAVFGQRWEYTGGVEVWNLEKKQRVARFGEEELFFVTSIEFAPDGKTLLTSSSPRPPQQPGDHYKRVRLWRTSGFKTLETFGECDGGIASARFSPTGQFVVFAANPATAGANTPSVHVATLLRQKVVATLLRKKEPSIYRHDVNSFSPSIRIWNAVSKREEPELELPKGRVRGLAFSLDGRILASCGSSLLSWNFDDRKVIMEFPQKSSSSCVAFSPDGRILASGGGYRFEPGRPYQDCGVTLWDGNTGRLIAFLPHERPVHSLAFSPDGQRIVAGGERGELLMWSIESYG